MSYSMNQAGKLTAGYTESQYYSGKKKIFPTSLFTNFYGHYTVIKIFGIKVNKIRNEGKIYCREYTRLRLPNSI